MKRLCDYGCGNEATYQLKSGKWCCSKSVNSCPAMRRKNSQGCKEYCKHNVRKSSYGMRGKIPWNKGLTAKTDERVASLSKKISKILMGKSHHHSEETRAKISKTMKEKGLGGLRSGSGRGKKGWYKGYYCDSTWELAFLIFCLDHSIEIKRCEEAFEYVYDNDIHLYHPDFIVNNNEYIEIKGYQTKKDDAKFFAFPKDKILKVYKREDMKEIFDYVLNEYNISKISDIHLLYDSCKKIKKHKDRKSKVNYIEIEKRINRIKNSNIDFSKFGWVQKVAILENISHTQVKRFMELHMKDFYNVCYSKKSPRAPLND